MSKAWGHGFHKGKVEGVEEGLDKGILILDPYAASKNEWKLEQISSVFKSNITLIGICPFHKEKSPSCTYEPLQDKFYCYSCGKEGNGFELAQKIAQNE